jgi:hypothetical protein
MVPLTIFTFALRIVKGFGAVKRLRLLLKKIYD